MKKISVIIPVYNVEEYLDTCIYSVCNQTYQNLEIILVDDGSTDGSSQICEKWKEKDQRIIVIHKENGGLSDARNAALEICTGDYIGFVDADDWIEPTMYEVLINCCMTKNVKVSACRFRDITDKEDIQKVWQKKEQKEPEKQQIDTQSFSMEEIFMAYVKESEFPRIYHCVWSKLYCKDVIGSLRFEVGKKSEDIVFTTHIFTRIKEMGYVDAALYDYNRIRENSIMNKKNEEHVFVHEIPNWQEQFRILENSSFLKKNVPVAKFYFYWRMLSYAKEFRANADGRPSAVRLENLLRQEKKEVCKACKEKQVDRKKALRIRLFLFSPVLYWKIDEIKHCLFFHRQA